MTRASKPDVMLVRIVCVGEDCVGARVKELEAGMAAERKANSKLLARIKDLERQVQSD